MLEGIIRKSIQRKATKALRRDGYLIANVYGKGISNINAAFKENEFIKAVKVKTTLTLEIKLEEQVLKVVIVDYQRDPITNRLLHVDLRVAIEGEIAKYLIPVKSVGTPIGLKNKGVLVQSKKRLLVRCDAANLVPYIEVDVSKLNVDEAILIRDIKVSDGIKILEADRIAVLGVIKAK